MYGFIQIKIINSFRGPSEFFSRQLTLLFFYENNYFTHKNCFWNIFSKGTEIPLPHQIKVVELHTGQYNFGYKVNSLQFYDVRQQDQNLELSVNSEKRHVIISDKQDAFLEK